MTGEIIDGEIINGEVREIPTTGKYKGKYKSLVQTPPPEERYKQHLASGREPWDRMLGETSKAH